MPAPPSTRATPTARRASGKGPRAATPMAFVQAMVAAYLARGLDPSHALSTAQIAPDSMADPAARITAVQMEAVSEAAMRELDDEGSFVFMASDMHAPCQQGGFAEFP